MALPAPLPPKGSEARDRQGDLLGPPTEKGSNHVTAALAKLLQHNRNTTSPH